jgi:hypothetical protein
MLARYMRHQSEAETGCSLEGVVAHTVMLSVAFDEKFNVHCSILDSDDRGLGSEINYIPSRLVLSRFAA